MEIYKCRLPAETADNTYNYCLSLYEFALKNFEKALGLLSSVKYDGVYQKTELRCLTAQLYYELDMTDSLLTHLDSFRHFLCNDRLLPEERKQYFYNFIKYLKNLAGARDKCVNAEPGYLARQISEEQYVYNKDWLLEKARKLEKIRN
jgi:hypothetical protein